MYSGLAAPAHETERVDEGHRLVLSLDRVAQVAEQRQFVSAVESGELFSAHPASFDPAVASIGNCSPTCRTRERGWFRLAGEG